MKNREDCEAKFNDKKQKNIDIDYLMTLSADALPQIMRLTDSNVQYVTRIKTIKYLKDMSVYYAQAENNWQGYNLSIERNKNLLAENISKVDI